MAPLKGCFIFSVFFTVFLGTAEGICPLCIQLPIFSVHLLAIQVPACGNLMFSFFPVDFGGYLAYEIQ